MKVLYIAPYPPAQDGIGQYTWTLANAVRRTGADIRVVVPRYEPNSPDEILGAIAGPCAAQVRSAVLEWHPDVIHVQFAIAAFGTRTRALIASLRVLRRELRVPIVATLHESTRDSSMLPVVGRALYRAIADECDQLIVHTNTAMHATVERLGIAENKVRVIPHPIAKPETACSSSDDLRFRFRLGNARILLAFGFIHVDKGLNDLVRALGILRRTERSTLDDVILVVAGTVRPRSGLFRAFEVRDRIHLLWVMRRARQSGLTDHIVMTGYVPVGEVATWFDIAEAAVLPYRRIEESGVACLARSFDIPVLASTVGGLAQQFEGSSWSFPPRNPERLAATIGRFLTASPAERALEPTVQRSDDLATVVAGTLSLYGSLQEHTDGAGDDVVA